MAITPIDGASVHRLTSGQVVTSLATAVKELVDNALDARARAVEVRFKNSGLDSIEVVDDGSGIPSKDYGSIALKHHTSKLSSFADLTSVRTLGFRGEALSSLCALCDKVEVITATADEAPVGTIVRFDKAGRVERSDEKVARLRGTTVALHSLFAPTPVRLTALEKNMKREFGKAIALLQGYALVAHLDGESGTVRPKGQGVRWNVVSTAAKGGKKTVHLKTDGNGSLKATLSSIWGPKAAEGLVEVDFEVALPGAAEDSEEGASLRTCRVHGLISSPTEPARSSADRQFYSINARPFTPTKIQKAVNDAWRSLNPAHVPVVILNLFIPPDTFDVNVSPDKRTVFFHDENFLLEGIRSELLEKFAGSSSSAAVKTSASQTPAPNLKQTQLGAAFRGSGPGVQVLADELSEESEEELERKGARAASREEEVYADSSPRSQNSAGTAAPRQLVSHGSLSNTEASSSRLSSSIISQLGELNPAASSQRTSRSLSTSHGPSSPPSPQANAEPLFLPSPSRSPSPSDLLPPRPLSPIAQGKQRERPLSQPVAVLKVDLQRLMHGRRGGTPVSRAGSAQVEEEGEEELEVVEQAAVAGRKRPLSPRPAPATFEESDDESRHLDEAPAESPPPEPMASRPATTQSHKRRKPRSLPCDSASIILRYRSLTSPVALAPAGKSADASDENGQIAGELANVRAPAAMAEAELSRTILKADFATMEPLGQFNLGFIIARKRGAANEGRADDLFIVDQHASDEKFNFETLQNETRILSQGLIQPRVLELSAVDVELVQDNLDVLKQNGFEVGIEETIALDEEETGQRIVTLRAQPVSKDTVFDFSDLEELLHLMKDQPSGKMVRCSKARAMFAMRACKKSVKIGMPLTRPQMTKVVRNMGQIDQPWNCPHGRPTMRHLYNLADVGRRSSRTRSRPVPWASVLASDDFA